MAKSKRSKQSYIDAGKKAARTRKRNSKSGVTTSSRKTTTVRKYTKKPKGLLGELWTPAAARKAGTSTMAGFGGGFIGKGIDVLVNNVVKPKHSMINIGILLAAGFATSALLRRPELGAGIASVAGWKIGSMFFGKMELADGENVAYARDIARMPKVLDATGQPMADGEEYLQDALDLQDDNSIDLQEGIDYQVDYAPEYGSPTF